MKTGAVHETLRRLCSRLEEEGIPHAIVGGMALAAHGFLRVTNDVDVLVTPAGLERFRERCVGRGYRPKFEGARKTFRDTATDVAVEFLVAGEFPGDGKPKPVSFPPPGTSAVVRDGIRVLALEHLIAIKLASGMSAPHRLRDLADVQDLVMALELPVELGDVLDESVRPEWKRLWAQARLAASEGEPGG